MFRIGIGEVFLIVLAIIVLLRPKDLPGLLRKAGRYYAQVRHLSKTVSASIRDVENEINRHANGFEEAFSCDTTIEQDSAAPEAADASGEADNRTCDDIR